MTETHQIYSEIEFSKAPQLISLTLQGFYRAGKWITSLTNANLQTACLTTSEVSLNPNKELTVLDFPKCAPNDTSHLMAPTLIVAKNVMS